MKNEKKLSLHPWMVCRHARFAAPHSTTILARRHLCTQLVAILAKPPFSVFIINNLEREGHGVERAKLHIYQPPFRVWMRFGYVPVSFKVHVIKGENLSP